MTVEIVRLLRARTAAEDRLAEAQKELDDAKNEFYAKEFWAQEDDD